MNVNQVLVFQSIDEKRQNQNNKPGNFTVKFLPEFVLDKNKRYYLALDHLGMTASWHNRRPEYQDNKLIILKTNAYRERQ